MFGEEAVIDFSVAYRFPEVVVQVLELELLWDVLYQGGEPTLEVFKIVSHSGVRPQNIDFAGYNEAVSTHNEE